MIKAYQASYAALRNISFSEFKRQATQISGTGLFEVQNVEEVHEKVRHFIDDFRWEEV